MRGLFLGTHIWPSISFTYPIYILLLKTVLGGKMPKKLAKKTAGRGSDQYMLRLPDGMRETIAKRAAENGRSINTEIIAALEQYLAGADRYTALLDFIEVHRENITKLDGLYFVVEELYRHLDLPAPKW
jgi:hypothetical protein